MTFISGSGSEGLGAPQGASHLSVQQAPAAEHRIAVGRPGRSLSLYPAIAGYDLQQELDYLANRALEIHRDCRAADLWPNYDDPDFTTIHPPAWAREDIA